MADAAQAEQAGGELRRRRGRLPSCEHPGIERRRDHVGAGEGFGHHDLAQFVAVAPADADDAVGESDRAALEMQHHAAYRVARRPSMPSITRPVMLW